jgi:hypothetical protein
MSITSDVTTLKQMREQGDEGALVRVPIPFKIGEYADDYKGWRITQYLWQGAGPVGYWFWQAENEAYILGETVLLGPDTISRHTLTRSEAERFIAEDAVEAVLKMKDPEWARQFRTKAEQS